MLEIYKILHNGNPIYIGQTSKGLETRFRGHFHQAESGRKTKIADKLRKYPREEFSIKLIEIVTEEIVDEREQYWIAHYNTINEGCNLAIGGRTNRGMKYGPEYGERISNLRKTNKNWLIDSYNGSEEQKKMLREKLTGVPRPWTAIMGRANKGKRMGDENPARRPEVREKIRLAAIKRHQARKSA